MDFHLVMVNSGSGDKKERGVTKDPRDLKASKETKGTLDIQVPKVKAKRVNLVREETLVSMEKRGREVCLGYLEPPASNVPLEMEM
jgi:hypothetical protein